MTQIIENNEPKFDGKEKIIAIFFVFFAVIVIIAQVLQYTNTKKTDQKYSEIISSKNSAIHATHSILIQSSTIQRTLFNLTLNSDPEQVGILMERLTKAAKHNEDDLAVLKNTFSSDNKEEQELLGRIIRANEAYKDRYKTYMKLLNKKEKTKDELQTYRLTIMRPALDGYQGLQQELLTMFTNDFEKQSMQLSESNSRTSWTLLVLGMSPYLFVLLSLVYFILKLVGLSFLSREKV